MTSAAVIMKPEFLPLATWIRATYGVLPLNIIYDRTHKDKQPRLQICLACEKDRSLFMDATNRADERKQQQIASQFKKSMAKQDLLRSAGPFDFLRKSPRVTYKTDNLAVMYILSR